MTDNQKKEKEKEKLHGETDPHLETTRSTTGRKINIIQDLKKDNFKKEM